MTSRRTCASTAGSSPGIRPGKRTAEYIDTILSRITLAGAVYLSLVAILPTFLTSGFRVEPIPVVGDWLDAALPRFITEGMGITFIFGGTSLLILVGVAMDTVQQVGVAADHAALRWVHEEDTDTRTQRLTRTFLDYRSGCPERRRRAEAQSAERLWRLI